MTDTNRSGPGGFDARDEYDITEIRRSLEDGHPPRLIGPRDRDQAAVDAVLAGIIGHAEEREIIVGLLAEVTQTSDKGGRHRQHPMVEYLAGVDHGRAAISYVAVLATSAEVLAWPFPLHQADNCQHPDCWDLGRWYVRNEPGHPAYRRLCTGHAFRALTSTSSATSRKDDSR